MPKECLREIKKLTRNASPWDSVKDAGLAAVGAGEATVTAKRLLNTLQSMGIFVVPCGEMEGFCRSIGGHGPKWVETVLQRELGTDPELGAAREFTQQVSAFLQG